LFILLFPCPEIREYDPFFSSSCGGDNKKRRGFIPAFFYLTIFALIVYPSSPDGRDAEQSRGEQKNGRKQGNRVYNTEVIHGKVIP